MDFEPSIVLEIILVPDNVDEPVDDLEIRDDRDEVSEAVDVLLFVLDGEKVPVNFVVRDPTGVAD